MLKLFHCVLFFSFLITACQAQSPKLCVEKADQFVANKQINEAVLLYQNCIQENPDEPIFYLNQAALLRDQERYVLAERAYNGALRLSFESFWPYVGLARVYAEQENYDDAKDVLLSGLNKIPNNPQLLFYLGKVHYALGEGDSALQYLDRAFAAKFLEPLRIYYYKAVVYQDLIKDNAKAASEFKMYFSFDDAKVERREDAEKRVREMGEGLMMH